MLSFHEFYVRGGERSSFRPGERTRPRALQLRGVTSRALRHLYMSSDAITQRAPKRPPRQLGQVEGPDSAVVHSHGPPPHNRSAGCAPSREGEGRCCGDGQKNGTESGARSVPLVEPLVVPKPLLGTPKGKLRGRRISAGEFTFQVPSDHQASARFGPVWTAPFIGDVGSFDEPAATPVFDGPAFEGVDTA